MSAEPDTLDLYPKAMPETVDQAMVSLRGNIDFFLTRNWLTQAGVEETLKSRGFKTMDQWLRATLQSDTSLGQRAYEEIVSLIPHSLEVKPAGSRLSEPDEQKLRSLCITLFDLDTGGLKADPLLEMRQRADLDLTTFARNIIHAAEKTVATEYEKPPFHLFPTPDEVIRVGVYEMLLLQAPEILTFGSGMPMFALPIPDMHRNQVLPTVAPEKRFRYLIVPGRGANEKLGDMVLGAKSFRVLDFIQARRMSKMQIDGLREVAHTLQGLAEARQESLFQEISLPVMVHVVDTLTQAAQEKGALYLVKLPGGMTRGKDREMLSSFSLPPDPGETVSQTWGEYEIKPEAGTVRITPLDKGDTRKPVLLKVLQKGDHPQLVFGDEKRGEELVWQTIEQFRHLPKNVSWVAEFLAHMTPISLKRDAPKGEQALINARKDRDTLVGTKTLGEFLAMLSRLRPDAAAIYHLNIRSGYPYKVDRSDLRSPPGQRRHEN